MTELEIEFLVGMKDDLKNGIEKVETKLDDHIKTCTAVNQVVDRHTTYFQLMFLGVSTAWAALIAWWKPHS